MADPCSKSVPPKKLRRREKLHKSVLCATLLHLTKSQSYSTKQSSTVTSTATRQNATKRRSRSRSRTRTRWGCCDPSSPARRLRVTPTNKNRAPLQCRCHNLNHANRAAFHIPFEYLSPPATTAAAICLPESISEFLASISTN